MDTLGTTTQTASPLMDDAMQYRMLMEYLDRKFLNVKAEMRRAKAAECWKEYC